MTTIVEVHWHKSNLTAGTHKQVRYEILKQALEDNFSFLPINCAKKKLQATNDVQKTSSAYSSIVQTVLLLIWIKQHIWIR